ncbi:MAG TPA: DUF4325 domain-containing protein [Patescibacteria group bacterium]|nr:DUF4325 domain-containing protein [Patescibacteria group bacterium]
MDIKELIIEKIKQKGSVESKEIVSQTGLSRGYVNRFFQALRIEGKIALLGSTNQARYVLANKESWGKEKEKVNVFNRSFTVGNQSEENVLQEVKQNSGVVLGLKDNVRNIIEYAFLEMVNNAIEHSGGSNFKVSFSRSNDVLIFSVHDDGVGIFEHIKNKFGLPDILSAVQQLLKGKQTTDPEHHSGQGIFFTSKMADAFTIKSSGKVVLFNNLIPDLFLEDKKTQKGTMIIFAISLESNRIAEDVFREYTNEEYEFFKTKVKVKLYKISRNLLSRSEARRILLGLEKFSEITLDFQNVETVGQSFADEIFRVWQNNNPDKKITYENANPNVTFMIKRAL